LRILPKLWEELFQERPEARPCANSTFPLAVQFYYIFPGKFEQHWTADWGTVPGADIKATEIAQGTFSGSWRHVHGRRTKELQRYLKKRLVVARSIGAHI
jgi:hypothetical protein